MQIAGYNLRVLVTDMFRLDGGAMFGSVPKVLWSRLIRADEDNCIPLACRVLVLEGHGRVVLVDLGMGNKWSEKERKIYGITPLPAKDGNARPLHERIPNVTDVILTHLHFDHAGGVSYVGADGRAQLSFPKARYFLQKSHWDRARSPGPRERASFIAANIEPLEHAQLELVDDGQAILPEVTVHVANGHTRGLQWVRIGQGDGAVVFPADLIPTAHHVSIPYVMGYDICAETSMREKAEFLEAAARGGWTVVFEHDPDTAAARFTFDTHGRITVSERITLPEYQ